MEDSYRGCPKKQQWMKMAWRMMRVWVLISVALVCAVPSLQIVLPRRYSNSSASFGPLKFTEDGTFQISIFEDLHFGESKPPIAGLLNSIDACSGLADATVMQMRGTSGVPSRTSTRSR